MRLIVENSGTGLYETHEGHSNGDGGGAGRRGERGRELATFYVQLIRGTDTEQPPVPGSKCVGHKLAETFRGVFKCKGFWEINRQQVAVSPGQVKRVQLGNGREAEIDLRARKNAGSRPSLTAHWWTGRSCRRAKG